MKKLLIILFMLPLFAVAQMPNVMYVLAGQSVGGLKDGLISVWEFDETTGTDAFDSHGSNDGVSQGVYINQTGKINKAYNYTGGTTDQVAIPDIFNGISEFTISTWFKIDDLSGTKGIISSWWGEPYRNILFRVSNSNLQFFTYTSAQVGGTFATVSAATWYHVVCIYDGSDMSMYINNSLDNTTFSQTGNIGEGSSHESYIGNYRTSAVTTLSFDGLIDQIAIWDRVLTIDEILDLWNDGNGLPYTSFGLEWFILLIVFRRQNYHTINNLKIAA